MQACFAVLAWKGFSLFENFPRRYLFYKGARKVIWMPWLPPPPPQQPTTLSRRIIKASTLKLGLILMNSFIVPRTLMLSQIHIRVGAALDAVRRSVLRKSLRFPTVEWRPASGTSQKAFKRFKPDWIQIIRCKKKLLTEVNASPFRLISLWPVFFRGAGEGEGVLSLNRFSVES